MNDTSAMSAITCVLSTALGTRVFSEQLADAVDRCAGPSRKLWFTQDVYRAFPAPAWVRRVSAYESEYVARHWLRSQFVDGTVVVNGCALAMAGNWQSMVVATDATPAMMARMSLKLTSRAVNTVISKRFRGFASAVLAWLPISETCRKSLVNDYGIPAERCVVTHGPQTVVDPTPHTPQGSLLFVGNDFVRKGGPLLLRAMERNLLPGCRLTIVSNDPCLRNVGPSTNVRVVSGIRSPAQLSSIYRDADLLVLPTKFDVYSLVICEAAAYGIPAVATRVGGVGELLDETGGVSLPNRCSAEDIALGVHEALGSAYATRVKSASQFARERLTLATFDLNVRRALRFTAAVRD